MKPPIETAEQPRRPYTPLEAAFEYGLPIIGHLIAGAAGGAIVGFGVGLIPGLAVGDTAAFTIIEWFVVAGLGFGLAKWNYTRKSAL